MLTRKNKHILYFFCVVAMIVCSVFALLLNVHVARAENKNVSMTEIAEGLAASGELSGGYATEEARFDLLWGDIEDSENLSYFSNKTAEAVYKYDSNLKINCFFYYSGNNVKKINAGQKGYESVIKVTAAKDIRVTVKHAAFTTTANNLKLSTLLKLALPIGDITLTAKSNNCGAGSTSVTENLYGGEYHLQAGDALYFVVGSTNTYQITNNAIDPSFDISEADYDGAVRASYASGYTTEQFGFAEIAAAFRANDVSKADYVGLVQAGFRYGKDFSSLNTFVASNQQQIYAYDGSDAQGTNFFFIYAGANAGNIHAGANAKSVVYIKALYDVEIRVTMPDFVATQNNVVSGLAISREGEVTTLLERRAYVGYTHFAGMDETLSLKAGEELYWYAASLNDYYVNNTYMNPMFYVDATAYDATAHDELVSENKHTRTTIDYNSYAEDVYMGGTYILPVQEKLNGETGTFLGWRDDERLYKAGTEITIDKDVTLTVFFFHMEMADGASIRFNAPTGLRWETRVDYYDLRRLTGFKNVEITTGTLIAPTDYLDGIEFTFAGLDNAENLKDKATKYLDVVNGGYYNEESASDDGYYLWYGSIVGILENNYKRAFSAVGYVKISIDGEETVVYGGYDQTKHSRSVKDVATAAYNDLSEVREGVYAYETEDGKYSRYTESERRILKGYMAD